MVDFRKILIAYINHVATNEGVTFLSRSPSYGKVDGLTDEENEELLKCDDEAGR